jgi:hypothetical protein
VRQSALALRFPNHWRDHRIIDTCSDAWNWLIDQTGVIRSLCSYAWLEQVSN